MDSVLSPTYFRLKAEHRGIQLEMFCSKFNKKISIADAFICEFSAIFCNFFYITPPGVSAAENK